MDIMIHRPITLPLGHGAFDLLESLLHIDLEMLELRLKLSTLLHVGLYDAI